MESQVLPVPLTISGAIIAAALIVLCLLVTLVHRTDKTRRITRLADDYGVDDAIRLHQEIEGGSVKAVVREIKKPKPPTPNERPP